MITRQCRQTTPLWREPNSPLSCSLNSLYSLSELTPSPHSYLTTTCTLSMQRLSQATKRWNNGKSTLMLCRTSSRDKVASVSMSKALERSLIFKSLYCPKKTKSQSMTRLFIGLLVQTRLNQPLLSKRIDLNKYFSLL